MTFNHGSEDLRLPEMVYKKVVDKYQDIRDDRDAKAKAFLDGARPYMICQTPAVSGYPRHMGERENSNSGWPNRILGNCWMHLMPRAFLTIRQ